MYSSKCILVLCALMLSVATWAQDSDKPSFKERLVFGGDLALGISNNQTIIGGSPLIGYKVSEKYVAGVGYTYTYFENQVFSSNYHGPRVFNRFYPIEAAFAHAEFEHMTFTDKVDVPGEGVQKFTRSFPALLVGGGYRQEIGSGVYMSFTLLFDVIEDPDSFYNGPIFRGGIGVGF